MIHPAALITPDPYSSILANKTVKALFNQGYSLTERSVVFVDLLLLWLSLWFLIGAAL